MAEGGGYKKEGSTSLVSGSEFSFDFYCELCNDYGKSVEATGFCVECGEYLCSGCYNAHPMTRQTRLHKLLDKEHMPKGTPLPSERMFKDITRSCIIHTGRPVEFYCKAHDVLTCSMCFVTGHKSCSDIESVLEKSGSILNSQEYKDFIQTLKSLDKISREMHTQARDNISQTKTCYLDTIKSAKLFRERVITSLDKLVEDIIAEAQTLKKEVEKKMASITDTCSKIIDAAGRMLTEFQSIQSSRRVCQLYISMKDSSKQVKTLQEYVREAEEDIIVKLFMFQPNTILQNVIDRSSPYKLGSISHKDQVHTKFKPKHIEDILINRRRNQGLAIYGSAVISSDRLVIAYIENNKNFIQLVDHRTTIRPSNLRVTYPAYDITAIGNNRVAISCDTSHIITLLSVSDSRIEEENHISVSGKCMSVAYSRKRLIVTYSIPKKLEIMNLSGKVMKKVEYGSDGNQLFGACNYVCVSNDGDTIYVSDSHGNNVISLTFDGLVKSVYSNSELKTPQKICVGHHGYVYVCGRDSKNVHMLSPDLANIGILLTPTDCSYSAVHSVSHCQDTNRLYVGIGDRTIKVFQLQ